MKRTTHMLTKLFTLILISSMLHAQDQIEVVKDTIDFTLTSHNNIAVDAILNETDTLALMFHTDISSVSLTPDFTEHMKEVESRNSTPANSWTGTKDVEYIEQNHLKISNLEWDSLTLWLNLLSGPETDGKFGKNLFQDKVIEINYDQEVMVLHDSIDSELKDYSVFKLTSNENNSLFIEGVLEIDDKKLAHKFLIHSGYGGTIILDDEFCNANKSIAKLEVIEENELKDSFGNIIKTKKLLADQFEMGGISFDDVPFSYFDSDLEIQRTSVIGGEILKRFNMFLDVKEMNLYVKANQYTSSLFKTS